MAISLPQGFKIQSKEAIDTRLVLTKEQMLAYPKAQMPDKYLTICKDDGKLYIYDKSASPSLETGYFVAYEEKLNLPEAITKTMASESGKAAMEEAVASTLPGAMKDTLEDPVLGPQLVNNMFDSDHFEVNLSNKIDLSISVIQAIDSN